MKGVLDWETLQAYDRDDVYCINQGHSIIMKIIPENPHYAFEYFQCPTCKRQINHKQIVDAFIEVEKALEEEFNIAIQFYNGTLLIESLEFVGDTRNTMRPKLLSGQRIEEYKLLFKKEMEKLLTIKLDALVDLWPKSTNPKRKTNI
jgi:hypothetical protein